MSTDDWPMSKGYRQPDPFGVRMLRLIELSSRLQDQQTVWRFCYTSIELATIRNRWRCREYELVRHPDFIVRCTND